MDTYIKADIFFFVTTIAVVVVSLGLIMALYAIARAFNRIRALCEKVEDNIEGTSSDIKDMTAQIKESFLFNMIFFKKAKKKRS